MSNAETKQKPITLRYDGKQQRVVIVPDDEDRFVLSMEEAVKACRIFDRNGCLRFQDQFRALLTKLGTWVESRRDVVSQAILTAHTERLNLIRLSVLAIPDDSQQAVDCFSDPTMIWNYDLRFSPRRDGES